MFSYLFIFINKWFSKITRLKQLVGPHWPNSGQGSVPKSTLAVKRQQHVCPAPVSMELEPSPPGLEAEYRAIFTSDSLVFLQELVSTFDGEVDKILRLRISRKTQLDLSGDLPGFCIDTASVRNDPTWRVRPVPQRLQRRHVDVGDLAPCDTERFLQALNSPAQGLQVDFDDGNCPTYPNQIKGIHNVYRAVHNQFPNAPQISQAPVLMLRPRAWNMVEHNMMVQGKETPGPLFDFGLLMFHCAKVLFHSQSGPFFYLSKVESYLEARLWNNIFLWTEQKLGLPVGSIKATVLIENVLSAFEMEEILYELRDHSAGLNCGIWDYSASFVNKLGHREAFLLPDRSKYVNMQKLFLRSYMDLLVQTCHRRGALATGGMAALLLPGDRDSAPYREALASVTRLKLLEIKAGVDGFMVYDLGLIEPMQNLFQLHTRHDNQMHQLRDDLTVSPGDLLSMPVGGVTLDGLKYNIAVGIQFIDAWLTGKGHFFYRGQVEDSATAEISRSQVWQWIRHRTELEDDGRAVTRRLVTELTRDVTRELREALRCRTVREEQRLTTATTMFLEVVSKRDFPEFITTYLNQDHTFLSSQDSGHEGGSTGKMPRPKL
ncbi:malate synthase-like [Esox lucius]|uniref:malate synthase n=1 Tax=Esox lucius TaxID=8010 RepID=A0A3P8ZDW8_ESOLU|nr:malate synthase-like [Esox lucius]